MKNLKIFLFALGLTGLFAFYGCAECDLSKNDSIGDQFFTVTYLDPTGTNYLESVYNLSNVVVWVDTTGGENPSLELISPGYADGKFGPFNYSERFIDPRTDLPNLFQLLGRMHRFNYHMKKDTFGTDVFTVEFRLDADECNQYWSLIKYYRNGVELTEYAGNQFADIVIVE
jgi:hypothetical protein